jgi:hypothetical protein
MAGIDVVDQRKIDLTPLLQQGLDHLLPQQRFGEFPPGLRIDPVLGDGWRWNIVDPETSEVLETFTLESRMVATLATKNELNEFTLSVIRNALIRIAAREQKGPQE